MAPTAADPLMHAQSQAQAQPQPQTALPPARMPALRVSAFTATSAAGLGKAALLACLRGQGSALRANTLSHTPLPTFVGEVPGLANAALPSAWQDWDCRNNRLAWLALNQDGFLQAARAAIDRYGATRVAVLMGTSTSSIGASEEAYTRLTPEGQFPPDLARPQVHALHSLGGFVAQALGAQGPCTTVATACSSSAKVFAQAERLIRCGLVDAAVVGGVDSLCQSVLYGFHALGLLSKAPCRPFDAARDGINLAEAGGFALLERAPQTDEAGPGALYLIGHGESSDAHHMSAPHPQGLGAQAAIEQALSRAGIVAPDVGYINLHGTATPKNDAVEASVVSALFPATTRVGSTKGWTGHALGAAGIVEAVVCLLALQQGWIPGSLGTDQPDPALGEAFHRMLQHAPTDAHLAVAMSNSFGFGGNNAALLFARVAPGRQLGERTGQFTGQFTGQHMADEPTASAPGLPAWPAPTLDLAVLGIGLWGEGLGTWQQARAAWRAEAPAQDPVEASASPPAHPLARPVASLLPPAERRRAPATVSLALDVADQACQAALQALGCAPQTMRSVFCSSLGDMAITDYLCATLAESPELLSPLKFHHSVHNAASGYWTIGVGNMQASCAMAAGRDSFAQALLEAASQAVCEQAPVLLVAYDMASPGPLAPVTGSTAMLGLALVLAPLAWATHQGQADKAATAVMSLSLLKDAAPAPAPCEAALPALAPLDAHGCARPAVAALMAANPMGEGLSVAAQLACLGLPGQTAAPCGFKLSSSLQLRVGLRHLLSPQR
jgi:3-oxoacyl-[acyl-carrier-protein] synthase-1